MKWSVVLRERRSQEVLDRVEAVTSDLEQAIDDLRRVLAEVRPLVEEEQ